MKLIYQSKRTLEDVYASLADFKKFGALHPYMTNVEAMADGFRVEEKVPLLGFLKISNTYHVRVQTLPQLCQVVYLSQIKKSVALKITWTVTREDGVSIEEHIDIQANPIVRYILGTVMKNAHQKVINNLEKNSIG